MASLFAKEIDSEEGRRLHTIAFAALAAALIAIFYVNAWIVDDAYITFRTVENFVAGRGMTWNPGERVQVFTHPLWMLLMSGLYAITGELFKTSLGLSFVLSFASIAMVVRSTIRRQEAFRGLLFGLFFLSGKAIVDFSSSGLESPLAYLLAAAFFLRFLPIVQSPITQPLITQPPITQPHSLTAQTVLLLPLFAALAFVNRFDNILLYLPALLWLLWRLLSSESPLPRSRALALFALGLLPALLWLLFSTFYFGFPFPNTFYAKVATGAPLDDRLARGLSYLANSVEWDTASYLVLALAWLFAVRQRHRSALLALAGAASYFVFILFNACTTHMSGRLCAVPLFVAALLLAELVPAKKIALIIALLLLGNALVNPRAPWKMGSRFYRPAAKQDPSRIDTNATVHSEGMALFGTPWPWTEPKHRWYRQGVMFHNLPQHVSLGGAGEAIGYFGAAAGPDKTIVDVVALADPLLARLPACNVDSPLHWKSGHFYREPPDGYLNTQLFGTNLITDPALHEYYDRLELLTHSPLFAEGRLREIWRMNTNGERALLEDYLSRHPVDPNCAPRIRSQLGPIPRNF